MFYIKLETRFQSSVASIMTQQKAKRKVQPEGAFYNSPEEDQMDKREEESKRERQKRKKMRLLNTQQASTFIIVSAGARGGILCPSPVVADSEGQGFSAGRIPVPLPLPSKIPALG